MGGAPGRFGRFIRTAARFHTADLRARWLARACLAFSLALGFAAQAQANGDPNSGYTVWHTTVGCTSCHVTPQPGVSATTGAFSGMGSTVNTLAFYANNGNLASTTNGNNIAYATSPGYSPIPSTNTWGCLSTDTTATCYMSTYTGSTYLGSSGAPTQMANDVSAFFASFFSPALTNPGTLTFGSNGAVSVQIGGTYIVSSATAGWSTSFSATGLPTGVTISSSGLISGTTPTVTAPTTYTVTVTATNYNADGGTTATGSTGSFSFVVNPPPPVVTVAASPVSGTYGTAFSYSISASNSPTSYSVTGTLPTSVSVNSSTGVISGTPSSSGSYPVTLNACNAGGCGSGSLTINIANTITSASSASGSVGSAFSYTITSSGTTSGSNPYGVTGTLPAGLSLNTATGVISGTPTTAGTSSVTVSAATTLGTVSQTVTFTIAKGTQTITPGTAPTVAYAGTGTASASTNSGLQVAISVSGGGCTVGAASFNAGTSTTSATVTGTAAGTNNCTITYAQSGSPDWNAAISQTQTISIQQATQTITGFAAASGSITVTGTTTLSVTGSGNSGNPVVYSSTNTSICTVSGNTVTGVAAGTCTVAANQAGNTNYAAATQVTTNVVVGLNTQTLTFVAAPTVIYGSTGTVSATSSASLTPVTFTASGGGCTVGAPTTTTSATVTGTAAGTNNCTITASQAGNGTYASATATQTFSIQKANQTITQGTAPTVNVGATGTMSDTASSGLSVTYTSTTTSICTVSGSTVTGVAAGTCTINSDQAGNANYNAAPTKTVNITVGKGSQTISFGAAPTVVVGGTGTVSAGATSGLAVTYTSLTTGVCTVSGSTVTGVATGTCTIAANQAGDSNWNAATQVTQSFSIGQGTQTLTFGTAPSISVGATGAVSATSSAGLTPVTFTSTTASVCTVSGSTVTGVATGTCTIQASQAGNTNYAAATATQSFSIGQGTQTITFGTAPTVVVGGTGTVSASATSGLAVTYTSTTTGVCTVSGSTVTGVTTGTCTIAADQSGNTNWSAAAQVTQSFGIGVAAAPAVSLSSALNTPITYDFSYLTGITGVNVVSQPAHGTVTVSGTKLTYTPVQNYFGSDSFSYDYYVGGTASPAAAVTVTITGRPDPTRDADVTGLLQSEMLTAQNFRDTQMFNLFQRMESRHHPLAEAPPVPVTSGPEQGGSAPEGGTSGGGSSGTSGSAPANNASHLPGILMLAGLPVGNAGPSSIGAFPGTGAPGTNAFPGSATPLSMLLTHTLVSSLSSSALVLDFGQVSSALADPMHPSRAGDVELWGAGNLRFGARNQPGGGASVDFTTSGVTLGMDKRVNDRLTLGIGVGYARDRSMVGTDGTGSWARGNSLSLYSSFQATSNMFVDTLVGYGVLGLDATRYVSPLGQFADVTRSGTQVWGSLSTGYEYRGQGTLLAPYLRYNVAQDRLNPATETGAGSYALNYGQQRSRSQQLSLGFRAETQHEIDAGLAMPRMRIEFQHNVNGASQTSLAYADLLSTRYNLWTPGLTTNSLLLGVGSGFALDNGYNIDFDYLRQHTAGQEFSQTLNFRLTRELDGHEDDSSIIGLAMPLGLGAGFGYTHETNVTHAADGSGDQRADNLVSLTLSKGTVVPVSRHTQLALKALATMDQYHTYTGLGHLSAGGKMLFRYRSSGEFLTPTFGLYASASAEQYESYLRDGYQAAIGIDVHQPVTDRLTLGAALEGHLRRGMSDVFNTRQHLLKVDFNLDMNENQALYFTGEYRRGDLIFSGQPSLQVIDISKVLVQDDVFTSPQMFDYRTRGNTVLTVLGYNIPIGSKDALDFSWRYIRSTPTIVAPYSAPGIRYTDNQIMMDYLVAF